MNEELKKRDWVGLSEGEYSFRKHQLISKSIYPLPPWLESFLSAKVPAVRSYETLLAWMKEYGLKTLWLLDDECLSHEEEKNAAHIINTLSLHDEARKFIHSMFLVGASIDDVARSVNDRYKLNLNPIMMTEYKDIFFDLQQIKALEVNNNKVTNINQPYTMEQKLIQILSYVKENGSFYSGIYSKDIYYVMLHFGLIPDIPNKEIIGTIVAKSYFHFLKLMNNVDHKSMVEARHWAKTLADLCQQKDKYEGKDVHNFEDALQMEFEFHDEEHMTYDALLEGQKEEKQEIPEPEPTPVEDQNE